MTADAVCERCGHARNQHSRAEFRAPERCRAPDCDCPEFVRGWFPSDALLAGLGLRHAPPDETTGRLGLECYAPGYEATCPQCGDRHVTLMRVPGGPWLCWPCAHAEAFRDQRTAPNLTCGCGCLCAEHLDAVEDLAKLHAAHAAQLVALRGEIRQLALGCLPLGHCTDTCEICETAKHIAYLIGKHPLPDAEAALAKVREGAVREFLAKEPSGRYRAIPQHCGVWWTFGDDVASEDVALTEAEARAVANALNALGAKS